MSERTDKSDGIGRWVDLICFAFVDLDHSRFVTSNEASRLNDGSRVERTDGNRGQEGGDCAAILKPDRAMERRNEQVK